MIEKPDTNVDLMGRNDFTIMGNDLTISLSEGNLIEKDNQGF
jgi:hypothetical protein